MKQCIAIVILSIFLAVGCKENKSNITPIDADQIRTDILVQFDQIMARADTSQIKKTCDASPDFCDIYFNKVLEFNVPLLSTEFNKKLAIFNQDSFIHKLQLTISSKLANLGKVEKEIAEGVARLQQIIPNYEFGQVYTFCSGLAFQMFIFSEDEKDALAIGLDMFLHPEINYKAIDPQNPVFAEYLVKTYTKEYMAPKAMNLIIEDLIPPLIRDQRLIDHMIRNGKILFMLEQIMPEKEKQYLIDYSEDQYVWCTNNEKEIWAFLVGEKLLYNAEMRKINKYVNPSPKVPGMPKSAPGRTANFIGWQIIKAYLKRNPEIAITDLLAESDAQKILEGSKYKPR